MPADSITLTTMTHAGSKSGDLKEWLHGWCSVCTAGFMRGYVQPGVVLQYFSCQES